VSCQGHSLDLSSTSIPNSSWTEALPQKGWARKFSTIPRPIRLKPNQVSAAFTTEFFLLSVPRRSQKQDSLFRSETHALFMSM
jgi:hypothetical protein